MVKLPSDVNFIISTLEAAGHEAFAVGGCVRDIQRGVSPKDWDIATSATPSETKALFSRTVDTGIKHGTITVLLEKQPYEVTTYRIDGEYLDNRRPESVIFSSNINEDLGRRDFTMNAIAYNEHSGFVDPFGGQDDIAKKIIRCVGNAQERFAEDALRMLRAVRFAATTGFTVDGEILTAIKELRQNLANVSPERIREEMGKLICGSHPQALELLESTGLMPFVLQGREYDGELTETIKKLQSIPPHEAMRLGIFLSWAGENCEKILRDLRFDNKTIKETSQYVEFLPKPLPFSRYEIKKFLRILTPQIFENLLTLKNNPEEIYNELKDILSKNEPYLLKHLAINGKDLAEIEIPPGETMGEILENLLDAVLRDPSLDTKVKQLRWVLQHECRSSFAKNTHNSDNLL